MSLLKSTVSIQIRGFNNVLNSSKMFDIEPEVLNVGWAAVMMAYDGPAVIVFDS